MANLNVVPCGHDFGSPNGTTFLLIATCFAVRRVAMETVSYSSSSNRSFQIHNNVIFYVHNLSYMYVCTNYNNVSSITFIICICIYTGMVTENTRAKKFTEHRRRADADRAHVKNLTKSCKKAIVEAFTNYPSLAAVMKGIENCVIDIALQNTFFALDQI